jgi:hypothetical protein
VVTRQVRLQGITGGSRDGFEAMMQALEQGVHFGKICIRH